MNTTNFTKIVMVENLDEIKRGTVLLFDSASCVAKHNSTVKSKRWVEYAFKAKKAKFLMRV